MGYSSYLGPIRLADKYSAARMEAACARGLLPGAIGYQRVKSILESSQTLSPPEMHPSLPHENLRLPEHFQ